jgi:hypothetical protein
LQLVSCVPIHKARGQNFADTKYQRKQKPAISLEFNPVACKMRRHEDRRTARCFCRGARFGALHYGANPTRCAHPRHAAAVARARLRSPVGLRNNKFC